MADATTRSERQPAPGHGVMGGAHLDLTIEPMQPDHAAVTVNRPEARTRRGRKLTAESAPELVTATTESSQ